MGKLIVLEGLDGSGKATQARRLAEAIAQKGLPVRQITFPNYESPFCTPVKEYLGGALGEHPGDVNAYAASILFTIDRFASFRQDWQAFYEAGGILVADRYTTSNAVHQCSKLAPEHWQEYTDWLFELEYRRVGIPAPDLVVYLATDPAVSQRLLSGRYHGQEEKKDIHEKDLDYQAHSRAAAAWCAARLGWQTVDCCQGDGMKSIEEIARQVWQFAAPLLDQKGE